ncbi:hypothetical protein [Sphingosinicella terrae]|jgi:hypothetical protein|uniref:hypothetical protein n=1 Tax=Sphingosinicella terrae TaxID=2172047 RepID=UPI000E0D1644|nr:hypothetical protein [Sphingosinicella terrae]
MSWGGPEFVLAIIAISTLGWLASSWIRARHGYPLENEWSGKTYRNEVPAETREVERLSGENGEMRAQIGRLEERIRVLERIATDPAGRTARSIDSLR